jgi:hypothetical protein
MDCLPHIHLVAIHAEPGYRSETPGVGALCRRETFLAGAGVYRNSVHRDTGYVAAGWQPWELGAMRIGGIAGIATGYRDYPVPVAAVFLSVWHVHLTLLPKVPGATPATLGVSLTLAIP